MHVCLFHKCVFMVKVTQLKVARKIWQCPSKEEGATCTKSKQQSVISCTFDAKLPLPVWIAYYLPLLIGFSEKNVSKHMPVKNTVLTLFVSCFCVFETLRFGRKIYWGEFFCCIDTWTWWVVFWVCKIKSRCTCCIRLVSRVYYCLLEVTIKC